MIAATIMLSEQRRKRLGGLGAPNRFATDITEMAVRGKELVNGIYSSVMSYVRGAARGLALGKSNV